MYRLRIFAILIPFLCEHEVSTKAGQVQFYYLDPCRNLDELRGRLRKYIHYYNHNRIKLNLGGLSPVEYRTQVVATG